MKQNFIKFSIVTKKVIFYFLFLYLFSIKTLKLKQSFGDSRVLTWWGLQFHGLPFFGSLMESSFSNLLLLFFSQCITNCPKPREVRLIYFIRDFILIILLKFFSSFICFKFQ